MASLLGFKKKNADPEDRPTTTDSPAESSVSQPRASEADERTRLLPPPATGGRDAYLSPDDPAVSILLPQLAAVSNWF